MAAQPDTDTKAGSIVAVGLVGTLFLVVVVVALEALYFHVAETERIRKVVQAPYTELRRVQAEQLERLNGARAVEGRPGVVTIPIDRAMERIVEEGASRRP